MGDYNCVELPEDTQGSSNLLNGGELRQWKNWVRSGELVDVFFGAVMRTGPRFTRQRLKGDTMEYAILDRIYMSEGANWVETIENLHHEGKSGLSDHYPIILTLKLCREQQKVKIWRTYFKCRIEEVKQEGVVQELEKVWRENPKSVTDPRIKWELGWSRIKKVLQRRRREQPEQENPLDMLADKLAKVREEIAAVDTVLNRAGGGERGPDVKPDEEEINRIVDLLPPEKAPGLDGITVELVRECWPFIKQDCLEMIEAFWRDGKLTGKMKKGAINLIPKSDMRDRIKDWRPISLLGITYKIISKILDERLKPLLPKLINPQQTGFVQGRSIFDSILAVKLGQEWSQLSGQESILLKLDFIKAYDMVSHSYLWRVLEKMGFDTKFIQLLRGLVERASSVVHLNGGFTKDIDLQRGVRQGCPIAPLLFALSTQPLMAMLRDAHVEGRVHGLEVGNGCQILEALFADDTGLLLRADKENWENATAVVQRFETISGARLNVSKSLIIPIRFQEPPQWLCETGCKIALEGEVFTYLGCPIGVGISEEQVMQYLLDKLTRKMTHWTTRLLSWESRTVLAKHILLAMPSYVMMVVGLTADGMKELTRICRTFIWGTSTEGKEKKTLVAWEIFCKSKLEGGMGFTSFDTQAKALKMRFITQMLENQPLDWVAAANAIIEWKIADTKSRWKELTWTVPEILLLGTKMRMENTPTLRRMLDGWWEVRKWLHFKGCARDLPKSLQLEQLLLLGAKWKQFSKAEVMLHRRLFKTLKVTTLEEWTSREQRALQILERTNGETSELTHQHTMAEGLAGRITAFLEETLSLGGDQRPLQEAAMWEWVKGDKKCAGWNHTSREWRWLLDKAKPREGKLNRAWEIQWEPMYWSKIWKGIWQSRLLLRDKLWLWRVLNGVFFVNDKARKMGLNEGVCSRCESGVETVKHCFEECPRMWIRWARLVDLLQKIQPDPIEHSGGPRWIRQALKQEHTQVTCLLLIAVHTRHLWKERCAQHFRQQTGCIPVDPILQECLAIIEEMGNRAVGSKAFKELEENRTYLQLMRDRNNKENRMTRANQQRLECNAISTLYSTNDGKTGDIETSNRMPEAMSLDSSSEESECAVSLAHTRQAGDLTMFRRRSSELIVINRFDNLQLF
ncbi:hypothetical protein R1sor_011868 [Riccia sorocarpa]|uniref:Reverse transcriptase domain-containing protein n=1 Tax=Riccia sorocarpa TaxID=122646 RepID=A0ABD3I4T8_9MARC